MTTPEGLDQSGEAGCVIKMAVTAGDHINGVRVDTETPKVLGSSATRDSRVEQDTMLTSAEGNRDERRKTMLRVRRVDHLAFDHRLRCGVLRCAATSQDSVGGPFVHQEDVDDVVADGQNRHAVCGLQAQRARTATSDRLDNARDSHVSTSAASG
ncbi:MAG: hypothetical protein M5U31_04450 [Acidimicrobiia bacterium]|nr:hypothetical protein [Acidimicrobiia bacterium]